VKLTATKELMIVNVDAPDQETIIRQLGERLLQGGYVSDGFTEAILKREASFPTGLPTSIPVAIPHTDIGYSNQNAMAVATLKKPVAFHEMGNSDEEVKVSIVFMLAIKDPKEQIEWLQKIVAAFKDRQRLEELQAASDSQSLAKSIEQMLETESNAKGETNMLLEELRKEVVEYGCECLGSQLTWATGGNLSVRDPETGLIAIKPSGIEYKKIAPQDVPVIDANGKVIEGNYKPSSEWPMHTMIYRTRPDVMAVLHVHSQFATTFAVANREVPICTHDLAEVATGSVKVAPFELPGSEELGYSIINCLGENDVLLMQNHGSIAVAKTLKLAYSAQWALERACACYFHALQLGQVTLIPEEANRRMRQEFTATAFIH
jgi:ribulose-5-phosphate 4-epimerase/fuculose-1-phosphate aldolase/mannitol/fructose-specific phosphotransferase system IIA component (Ntr-type)